MKLTTDQHRELAKRQGLAQAATADAAYYVDMSEAATLYLKSYVTSLGLDPDGKYDISPDGEVRLRG